MNSQFVRELDRIADGAVDSLATAPSNEVIEAIYSAVYAAAKVALEFGEARLNDLACELPRPTRAGTK